MKIITRILSLLVLAGLTAYYVSCKSDDPEKSVEQQQFEKLVKTWELSSADNDGVIRTDEFSEPFTLTLSGVFAPGATHSYVFAGSTPAVSPFAHQTGDWKFGSPAEGQVIMNPGQSTEKTVSYTLSDTALTIEFDVAEGENYPPFGRTESVSGNWVFQFTAQ